MLPNANAGTITVKVQDKNGQPVPNVVVYLEGDQMSPRPISNQSVINIQQKDKGFKPYVVVGQTGDTVRFSNQDDITHHIYSVAGPEKFSFNIRAGEVGGDIQLGEAGVIAMGCNIHDWMSGFLLVTDSPFHALTDEHGIAIIEQELAAQLSVVAWHPQFNETLMGELDVSNSKQITLKLSKDMSEIPEQKGVDDFDFLEGY